MRNRNLVQNHEVADHGREFIANTMPRTLPKIIAAGPLFKQPGTVPYRTVLIVHGGGNKAGEFVVYREYFQDSTTCFEGGRYYGFVRETGESGNNEARAFVKAMDAFAKAIASDAEFARSLDRPDVLDSDEQIEAQAALDAQL